MTTPTNPKQSNGDNPLNDLPFDINTLIPFSEFNWNTIEGMDSVHNSIMKGYSNVATQLQTKVSSVADKVSTYDTAITDSLNRSVDNRSITADAIASKLSSSLDAALMPLASTYGNGVSSRQWYFIYRQYINGWWYPTFELTSSPPNDTESYGPVPGSAPVQANLQPYLDLLPCKEQGPNPSDPNIQSRILSLWLESLAFYIANYDRTYDAATETANYGDVGLIDLRNCPDDYVKPPIEPPIEPPLQPPTCDPVFRNGYGQIIHQFLDSNGVASWVDEFGHPASSEVVIPDYSLCGPNLPPIEPPIEPPIVPPLEPPLQPPLKPPVEPPIPPQPPGNCPPTIPVVNCPSPVVNIPSCPAPIVNVYNKIDGGGSGGGGQSQSQEQTVEGTDLKALIDAVNDGFNKLSSAINNNVNGGGGDLQYLYSEVGQTRIEAELETNNLTQYESSLPNTIGEAISVMMLRLNRRP